MTDERVGMRGDRFRADAILGIETIPDEVNLIRAFWIERSQPVRGCIGVREDKSRSADYSLL
jgi:hypothetical protein